MAYQSDYRRGSERDEEFRRSRGSEEDLRSRGESGEPYRRGYEERSGQGYRQQELRQQQIYGRERYGQQGREGFGQESFSRGPGESFGGPRAEPGRYGEHPGYSEEGGYDRDRAQGQSQSGYRRYGEGYGRGPEGFDRETEFGRGAPDFGGGYGETQRYGESFGTVGRNRGRFTGRGPKGYTRSDDRIREDVSDRLEQHGEIDATEIEVRVSNGEVTLEGTVEDRRTKRMAEDLVENCPGVKQVHNRIRIQGSTGQSISSRPSTTTSGTSGSSYRAPSPKT